jgi:hypothetical protein
MIESLPAEAGVPREKTAEEERPVLLAPEGVGSLFQRDYVAVVEGSALSPEAAVLLIRSHFPEFSPAELAEFCAPHPSGGPLQPGDTMHVNIRGAGHCAVIVTEIRDTGFTLRTLAGHIEAGRITFGAAKDVAGRLVLRIRSRARLDHPVRYAGYELLGRHAQTRIWVTFLERSAAACEGRLLGRVIHSTERVEFSPADWGAVERPTFERAIVG